LSGVFAVFCILETDIHAAPQQFKFFLHRSNFFSTEGKTV